MIITQYQLLENNPKKYSQEEFLKYQSRLEVYKYENLAALQMVNYYLAPPIGNYYELNKAIYFLTFNNSLIQKNQTYFNKNILVLNNKHKNFINLKIRKKGEKNSGINYYLL